MFNVAGRKVIAENIYEAAQVHVSCLNPGCIAARDGNSWRAFRRAGANLMPVGRKFSIC